MKKAADLRAKVERVCGKWEVEVGETGREDALEPHDLVQLSIHFSNFRRPSEEAG